MQGAQLPSIPRRAASNRFELIRKDLKKVWGRPNAPRHVAIGNGQQASGTAAGDVVRKGPEERLFPRLVWH